MSNYYEYRLYQIQILVNAYGESSTFTDEVEHLKKERDKILKTLNDD